MPVEFLSDELVAAYGAFIGPPTRGELERFFFLDDGDQATIPLAQEWGGGLVASADGMRFVVPVQTINAGPNPRYFGTGRGGTWQHGQRPGGRHQRCVRGRHPARLPGPDRRHARPRRRGATPGDHDRHHINSDIVFGLLRLLGRQFAPRLADMPDQKFWRIDSRADYGRQFGRIIWSERVESDKRTCLTVSARASIRC